MDTLVSILQHKETSLSNHDLGWDVIFLISNMYRNQRDRRILYTTRLPYWVDESKFGKWLNTDLNINSQGRLASLFKPSATSSPTKRIMSGNESKMVLVEAVTNTLRVDLNKFKEKLLTEADDEDEANDPDFTIEDGLADLLSNMVQNKTAVYEEVQKQVAQELKKVVEKGTGTKYEMVDEGEETKFSKPEDEMMSYKHDVVNACVDMWNSISEQKIKEGEEQSKYYLLQLISANDDELDGAVNSFEWPVFEDKKFKSKI
jgi:hypothetical protein